ncbi:acyl-CoA thioesterase [Panacibacter ginsenosidivorans]|uniref:Acyl-CoA thioesterase n=1 Tax=Panacibacter ginsenosidivorans TaxID=1813871 RepID=A0A5B8VDD9_9BACT|nr:acyl-CoA thioesterase [Panacibacter ginsenosidivorans]QEC69289.1 acyl-CoA thioesterase [Panacibacter ginsenosidivorans]
MTAFKKVLESNMKIRFHDCDPFNHLNNSRYIDYLITAREDQLLEQYDFDVYQLASEKGIGWVSAQTQISYIAPAQLMEEVSIQTQLISFSEKSLLFEAVMWNRDKDILKAVMWTKLVHFHLQTQKSFAHSEALMQFFGAVVNPLSDAADFETRVKQLKQAI